MEPSTPRTNPQNNGRIFLAELVGTLVLMMGGPGVAIISAVYFDVGVGLLGVALGFGLSLLIMAYVIGPISGCHINPAVTLGLFLARKISGAQATFSVFGQLVGAIAGGAIIYGIASGQDGWQRGQFAANLWTKTDPITGIKQYFGLGSTIVVEVVLTAVLVMVVLFTTTRNFAPGFGGVVVGLTLTVIHLISIPVDNTSVNPARSLGAAVFADPDVEALQQLWAFIVFPLIGAVVGVVLFLMLDESRLEDTALAGVPGLVATRDTLESVGDAATEAIEGSID